MNTLTPDIQIAISLPGHRKARLVALAPLAGATSVWILFAVLYSCFKAHQPRETQDLWFTAWVTSMFCLCFTLLWNLAVAIIIIVEFFSRAVASTIKTALYGVLPIFLVTVWFVWRSPDVGGTHAGRWLTAIANAGFRDIGTWLSTVDTATALVGCFMIVSLLCLGYAAPKLTVEALASRLLHFEVSLYSAACLLVFALIEIFTLSRWGAALASPTGDDRPFTRVIVAAAAAIFSTTLVALYAPVSLMQRNWREQLQRAALQEAPTLDVGRWLDAYGLSITPWKSALAMLAPLVAAAVAEILKGILG